MTVAVLDSGIATDADLTQPNNRILARVNLADPLPAFRRTIEPVNAAMIRLIQAIRRERMKHHAMRVLTVLGIRVG